VETEAIVEVVPGDAAEGVLADHAADDDAKFLGGRHIGTADFTDYADSVRGVQN
jgi:hypothetical protein